MTAQVIITVDDRDALIRVDRWTTGVSDSGILSFLRLGAFPYLADRAMKRFDSEGDDVTGAWPELAFNTGRIRASQGYGAWHPINRRTGALREFVRTSYRLGSGSGYTLTMPGNFGTKKMESKFRTAQQGGSGRKGGGRGVRPGPNRPAPPRPVLGLGFKDRRDLTISLLDAIQRGGLP